MRATSALSCAVSLSKLAFFSSSTGANFARTISVGAGVATGFGGIFSGTIDAEPRNARRHDNITVFDVKVERAFALGRGIRLRAFLDLFNLTNSNALETRTVTTGTSFLRPTAVLPPRAARIVLS